MSNRPNRNWRRAADQAADVHTALLRLPPGGRLFTPEKLEAIVRHAVIAGFDAGMKWRAAAAAPPP